MDKIICFLARSLQGPVQAWCTGTDTSLNIAFCWCPRTNLGTVRPFRQFLLYSLSNKLLKHRLQICRWFLDSRDLFLVVCELPRFRKLGYLNKVHFSAPQQAPSLNGASVSNSEWRTIIEETHIFLAQVLFQAFYGLHQTIYTILQRKIKLPFCYNFLVFFFVITQ